MGWMCEDTGCWLNNNELDNWKKSINMYMPAHPTFHFIEHLLSRVVSPYVQLSYCSKKGICTSRALSTEFVETYHSTVLSYRVIWTCGMIGIYRHLMGLNEKLPDNWHQVWEGNLVTPPLHTGGPRMCSSWCEHHHLYVTYPKYNQMQYAVAQLHEYWSYSPSGSISAASKNFICMTCFRRGGHLNSTWCSNSNLCEYSYNKWFYLRNWSSFVYLHIVS